MPVPKRKTSKTRKRVRRRDIKALKVGGLITCKNCGSKKLAHTVCKNCNK